MINLKEAEKEFVNYTSNFDLTEQHIERKVRHTFRVEEICEEIAKLLELDEEKIDLAKLIGLLHDIGRFEQYTRYKTYEDFRSIDHANLGVDILEKDNYIKKYIETEEFDKIIKKAIYNHNKYSIEEDLDEETEIFCKIIRDADKIDIMYEATCEFWKDNIQDIEKQFVSKKVYEQFMNKQIIDKRYVENYLDGVIVNIALIFDFNFKYSYNLIKEKNYINKTLDRFNFKNEKTKEEIKLIRKIANDYINEMSNK